MKLIMKNRKHFSGQILATFFSLALAGCSVSEPTEPINQTQPAQAQELSFPVTIQVSEELADKIEKGQAQEFLQENGILELRRVFPHAGVFEPRVRREGMHRFFYVTWDPDRTVTKAAASLENVPGILHVTPQFPIQPRATFNDPYFSSQWNFVNARYPEADINVQKVWEEFTVGKSNVIVSVVDEGVNLNHEDEEDNLYRSYNQMFIDLAFFMRGSITNTFYLEVGPQISINVHGSYKIDGGMEFEHIEQAPVELGINIGAGYYVLDNLSIGFRWYMGFNEVFPDVKYYYDEDFKPGKDDNSSWSTLNLKGAHTMMYKIGITYWFI